MSNPGNSKKIKNNGRVVSSPKAIPEKPVPVVKEYDFKIVAFIGLLVSLVLLVFSYQYFGSYFEMNDDPRYVMAMKGFASPYPYNNFVSVYKFTSSLYIWLYRHFPDTGWYGLSMFLLLWGALFNIFIIIYLAAYKRIHLLLITVIFTAFFFLVFLQNVYWINFTRPAILCVTSFILLLGQLYLHQKLFLKNKWIAVFPVITYVLAHFTRLDAGYLGFVFGTVSTVLIVSLRGKVFPFLLKYILPVFIFIVLIKFSDIVSQKKDPRNADFLEKTEIIRQMLDYRNAADFKPSDTKEKIAVNAMINARYCSDDKVMSKDFLKKLTKESPLLESGNRKKMESELEIFNTSLKEENNLARNFNIVFAVILFFWFFKVERGKLLTVLKYISLQVLFTGIIVGMSYFMKLPARIFDPLLVMLTLVNIVYLFSTVYFKNKTNNYLISLVFIPVIFTAPMYAKANKRNISDHKRYGRTNQGIFNEMNEFQNTIFIPTSVRSWDIHSATDPIKEVTLKNGNCYVYLSIELSLAPETTDQLIDKFGTSDHSKLFKKISEMNNVVFLSNDNYNTFLTTYYHFNYNQDYRFERARKDTASFNLISGLDFYRLRKM